MFPLGSVLFPHGVLPLHVFEPRYLTMMEETIDDDGAFGVALIERGWEVGGGDQRFDVGTLATIVRAASFDDGRLAVVAVGTERLRIVEWLPDAPYPVAMAMPHDDGEANAELPGAVDGAHVSMRRLLALASEMGADVGNVEVELPDDPREAAWTLCAIAPLEQLDRQRLLEIDDPLSRMVVLDEFLGERIEMLQVQLGGG